MPRVTKHSARKILPTKKDYKIFVGFPKEKKRIFSHLVRKNTASITGVALGDEGKGRLVNNKIGSLLKKKEIKRVYVVRFQGGNNAGHTLEKNGVKFSVHLLPSSVLCKKAYGILDRGMLIHPEDLQSEIESVEKIVGSLKNKLIVSDEAILSTDLERAEELLNLEKSERAKGGTGRGIAPSYAHHYDKLGLKLYDLIDNHWKETLAHYYERFEKEFTCFGKKLKDIEIPDFGKSRKLKKQVTKTVGTKQEFLNRLKKARNFLLKRKLPKNTFLLHKKIYHDKSCAVVFEGAQAHGLDGWLGTLPDVTASNTSVYGVREGTGFWNITDIEEKIGVFKIPYTSSVGARRMPTHIDLPKNVIPSVEKNLSDDQKWALWVREAAYEYGTTTGRPRDINFLDLPFLSYNAKMSGIEVFIATHLDICMEDQMIKICVGYKNKSGKSILYQPGLRHQKDILPIYKKLPGWDGEKCKNAKKIRDLPLNALRFLSFLQKQIGYPIVGATTGYLRKNFIPFEGYL